jgi:hypothetical protein
MSITWVELMSYILNCTSRMHKPVRNRLMKKKKDGVGAGRRRRVVMRNESKTNGVYKQRTN